MRKLTTVSRLFTLTLFFSTGWYCSGQDSDKYLTERLVQQINASRQEAGLGIIREDARLSEVATAHSKLIAASEDLTHEAAGEKSAFKRVTDSGIRYDYMGENVAVNSDFANVHRDLMDSPPHRANILNSHYDSVGIGIVRNGTGYWVTEDFAHIIVEQASENVEDSIAKSVTSLFKDIGANSVTKVSNPQVHDMACQIAQNDTLDLNTSSKPGNARMVLTYTNASPERLPAEIQRAARIQGVSSFATGACFQKTNRNPGGTYYVAIVFF